MFWGFARNALRVRTERVASALRTCCGQGRNALRANARYTTPKYPGLSPAPFHIRRGGGVAFEKKCGNCCNGQKFPLFLHIG